MMSKSGVGVPLAAIASRLRCTSRTVGVAATTATRKNMTKCCEKIVAVRPSTRPTRKSLSAKEADIVVFVIKGLFGVGQKDWQPQFQTAMPQRQDSQHHKRGSIPATRRNVAPPP